ncbi:MAG: type III-B CRISPR module-associated protein Cmr3 [Anaerolineae bacterium]|nr:type III-B CRISPR module-associated protein Cmr3 [Anaerolineae bacterium]
MSQSQWIFIRPNDVWLFRDNKPFSAQQNFVARGQFPPNPQVMTGAVRTHAYYQNPQHPIVKQKDMDELALQGPYVARMDAAGQLERFFPAPLDLLYDADNEVFSTLQATGSADFASNAPLESWKPLQIPKEDERDFDLKEAEGWLSETQFSAYLAGNLERGKLTPSSELFISEERVGIGLDKSRKANIESLFYHAEFTRPYDGVGLLIEVRYKEALFDESGSMKLGGESRVGHYQQVSASESLIKAQSGNLKVILLTAAYFSGGWQPSSGDWSQLVGKGKLVSAALGKPQAISGWDMLAGKPKPLRHFVPAGSVFYFEDAEWQGKAFSENVGDALYAQMGFGAVAVTSWQLQSPNTIS